MAEKALCIDIGGSKLLIGILDTSGRVLIARKSFFVNPDKEGIVQAILRDSKIILEDPSWKDEEGEEISTIGVSIPGLADREKGLWVYAPFSGIADLNIRDILEKEFHKPTFLENDGNICAVGEMVFGCAREIKDFLWITVSNGIGSGLVLDGKLYEGATFGAGEIGHVKVVDGGELCPCGGNGCLEAYAAGPGIARRFREKAGLSKTKAITAKEIAELAYRGDQNAIDVFVDEGYYLGKAIASVVNLLNLPLVVIGGGISGSYDLFADSMKKKISQDLFTAANRDFKVCRTALGYEAALIGAGALAFSENRRKIT